MTFRIRITDGQRIDTFAIGVECGDGVQEHLLREICARIHPACRQGAER